MVSTAGGQFDEGFKSAMRSAVKKVLEAKTAEEANQNLPHAMKRIDKAAKTNIIHNNAAARYKARMARTMAAK